MTEPKSMTDLFFTDPLKLSEQDIEQLVAHYREKRAQFNRTPAKAAGRTAASKASKAGISINLDL